MKIYSAKNRLDKIEFNNQDDWETYPTADYHCNCNETISINFKDLKKHQFSNFSNFNASDKITIEEFLISNNFSPTNSFLDFYCSSCNGPVRIYYESWAGGKHGESGYSIKYVIDK